MGDSSDISSQAPVALPAELPPAQGIADNLWFPLPRGARVGDWQTEWYGSGIGDIFPPLSVWPQHQIGDPLALSSLHSSATTAFPNCGRVCGWRPTWAHTTVFLCKALEEAQAPKVGDNVVTNGGRHQGASDLLQICPQLYTEWLLLHTHRPSRHSHKQRIAW